MCRVMLFYFWPWYIRGELHVKTTMHDWRQMSGGAKMPNVPRSKRQIRANWAVAPATHFWSFRPQNVGHRILSQYQNPLRTEDNNYLWPRYISYWLNPASLALFRQKRTPSIVWTTKLNLQVRLQACVGAYQTREQRMNYLYHCEVINCCHVARQQQAPVELCSSAIPNDNVEYLSY